jgi:hypothetical protein
MQEAASETIRTLGKPCLPKRAMLTTPWRKQRRRLSGGKYSRDFWAWTIEGGD